MDDQSESDKPFGAGKAQGSRRKTVSQRLFTATSAIVANATLQRLRSRKRLDRAPTAVALASAPPQTRAHRSTRTSSARNSAPASRPRPGEPPGDATDIHNGSN